MLSLRQLRRSLCLVLWLAVSGCTGQRCFCKSGWRSNYKPVCGEDGLTYQNACFALCQNVKIQSSEPCAGYGKNNRVAGAGRSSGFGFFAAENVETRAQLQMKDASRFRKDGFRMVGNLRLQSGKPEDIQALSSSASSSGTETVVYRLTSKGRAYAMKLSKKQSSGSFKEVPRFQVRESSVSDDPNGLPPSAHAASREPNEFVEGNVTEPGVTPTYVSDLLSALHSDNIGSLTLLFDDIEQEFEDGNMVQLENLQVELLSTNVSTTGIDADELPSLYDGQSVPAILLTLEAGALTLRSLTVTNLTYDNDKDSLNLGINDVNDLLEGPVTVPDDITSAASAAVQHLLRGFQAVLLLRPFDLEIDDGEAATKPFDPDSDSAYISTTSAAWGRRRLLRDDRYETRSHRWPFSTVGFIQSGCTGTLIGPRKVLTAGHCVYSARHRRFYSNVGFYPGRHNGGRHCERSSNGRCAQWTKDRLVNWDYVDTVFTNAGPPRACRDGSLRCHTPRDFTFDFAVITLRERVGYQFGWMGWGYDCRNRKKYSVTTAGYPVDKPGFPTRKYATPGTLNYFWACAASTDITNSYIGSNLDTAGGQSGSAIWDNQRQVIRAIHVSSGPRHRSITRWVYDTISTWVRANP